MEVLVLLQTVSEVVCADTISGKSYTVALKEEGTVVVWGGIVTPEGL